MKKSELRELVKEIIQVIPEEKKKGSDGKACWKGYRYAGTKNGKDVCIKVKGVKENNKLAEVAAPSTIPSDILYSLNTTKGLSGDHFYHIGTLLQALHRGSTIQEIEPEEKFYLHTVKFNPNVTIYPKVVNEDPEEGYDDDFSIADVSETDVVIYDNGVEGLDYPEPLPDGCKTANQNPNYSIYAHSRNFKVVKVEELTTGWDGDDYNDETNQHLRALYSACKLEYVPDVDETKEGPAGRYSTKSSNLVKGRMKKSQLIELVKEILIEKLLGEVDSKITLISVIDGKRNLDNEQLRQIFNGDVSGTFYIYTNEEDEYENEKPISKQEAFEYIKYYNSRIDGDSNTEERLGAKLGVLGIESELRFNRGEVKADPTVFSKNENYADGKVKGKSKPGRVKKSGASCKGSVTDLRAKAKKYGGEKGKMYHWCANMKSGKK